MKVTVHVREKAIVVPCGEGSQRVKWLGHVGIARYEPPAGTELGVPRTIKTDGGPLDLNAIVKDVLQDGAHVWVTTSGEHRAHTCAVSPSSPPQK
jgi:hypothetical protein